MRFPVRTSLLTAASAALLLAVGIPAQDDRENEALTEAIWVTGQSVGDLSARASSGWRIIDLEYESTASSTFTAALVRNTGSYAKGWWWLVGATGSQVGSTLAANNARLIDLEPYDDNGTTRFAAVMVSNTGADGKAWWWLYDATSAQVNSAVSSNNARLVDLERYTKNGSDRFAAVMVRNTGSDARGWSYYYGVSSGSIGSLLSQNNHRVYSLERTSSGTYDLIAIQNSGVYNWFYFGLTSAGVTSLLEQNVGRVIDIERYTNLLTGTTRYDVVMIDNANDLTRRAWLEFTGTDGAYGAFLKELNGPVLAEIRADFVFEPASLLKTAYHAYAMRRVALGLDSLSANVTVPLGTIGSCPNYGGSTTTESLSTVLRKMMENSDNNRTLAIADRYGVANMQAWLDTYMFDTSINHVIGCGGPTPNELTLRDLSRLHQALANGLLSDRLATFYELMPNSLAFPTGGTSDLNTLINAEASALGLPTYVRDAFKSAIVLAYKPGGYSINNVHYRSEGGFISLPFKDANGTITDRGFLFGAFNHGASNLTTATDTTANAELALVWDRTRAALRTWDNPFTGSVTSFGASCAGSVGTPVHTHSGTPSIGLTVQYVVSNAPAGTPVVLVIGSSNTIWSRTPLPLPLDFLNAPGCFLRVDPLLTSTNLSNGSGSASWSIRYALDQSLVGLSLVTQNVVFDAPANPLGLTTTNGLRTTLGGYR